MTRKWTEVPLGEALELKRGYDLPERDRRPGAIPVVTSAGITGFHAEARARGPGVVIGRYGTLGEVHYIPGDYWPHNTALYVRDCKGNHPRYLAYLLRTVNYSAHSDKAAVPGVNRNHLHQAMVRLAPRAEQEAIAHILGTLEDRIELNRRMNGTLEATARALFKSWFVDFDPVRAKADGRRPSGMDAETAALFPSSFIGSEHGSIPKGWRSAPIGDCVRVVGGSTPSTDEPAYWDGQIAFATPKDLAALEAPFLLRTERRITEAGVERISSGVLPCGTVLLSSRAPIGYLAIAEVPVAVNQGFVAMVCDQALPSYYVLHWARENLDTVIANANGTTFLEISKSNFRPIPALVPAAEVLQAFVVAVEPLFRRIVATLGESANLAVIRDALLPRLLSGEIRVKDAESLLQGSV